MARRVKDFEAQPGGGSRRYPWAEWTDGGAWEIRRGEDYDVATENMRVNLHMKAKQLSGRVRTRKVSDRSGEGLVFQFFPHEGEQESTLVDREADEAALEVLYRDCLHIYETARREVSIPRSDGRTQKYAPVRFRTKMESAYADGTLIAAVASTVERETDGFGHLAEAGREDLMLETFVLDTAKPYHHLFSSRTLEAARARMAEYRRANPGSS